MAPPHIGTCKKAKLLKETYHRGKRDLLQCQRDLLQCQNVETYYSGKITQREKREQKCERERRAHTCTRAHMHTRTHAHAHTCTRAHMHTRTHAHAHTRALDVLSFEDVETFSLQTVRF